MDTCTRYKERWFQIDILNGVYGSYLKRDRNVQEGEPFLFSKENNIYPRVILGCLRDLTQIEEIVIAKAHYYIIIKRIRGH
jgi:hypothetical protein